MKKIGLITIHDTLNYGSLLQTYALYKAIESLGVEIELIDYKCKAIMDRETTYPLSQCRNIKDNVAFAGFVALGGLYYKLWLPSEDTKLLHVLTIVTVLGSVTAGVMRPIYYVYTLTLKNKLPCWITIAGGFLNVVSMYVLLKYTQMGVYAIVSTTTVIMLCINLFFNPVYAAYNLKISVKVYYKVIFKHLISAAIMVGGFIGIARVIRPSGWIGLIASAIIMCISGLIIHVLIMCNMDEKLFLIKKITKRK